MLKHNKVVALLILNMLIPGPTQAQDMDSRPGRNYFNKYEDSRIFFGGLTAGFNFTQVDGDTYAGYHKAGFNGGAMVYVKLTKRLLANVQMLYAMRGSRGVSVYDDVYTGTTVSKYYLDLNYVEVPVILHYLINSKWQVGVGASYSQLVSSKEDAYSPYAYTITGVNQQFHKQDWEYIISGIMQIYRGWFVDMSYQYSLSSIRDADKIPAGFGGGGAQFNNLFTLRLVRLIRSGN